MTRVLGVLTALCAVAVLCDLAAPYRDTNLRQSRTYAGDVVVSAVDPHAVVDGRVTVTARGRGLVAVHGGEERYRMLGPGRSGCDDAPTWRCVLPFHLAAGGQLVIAGDGTIDEVTVEPVRAVRTGAVGVGALAKLALILMAVSAVFCAIGAPARLRASVGAVISAAWLVTAAGSGGALLLALIVCFYPLLALQIRRPGSRTALAATLGFVILAFITLKGQLPNLARGFADPGGFSLLIPVGFAFFVIRVTDLAFRAATRDLPALGFADYLRYLLFPATLAAGPVQTWPQFREDVLPVVTGVDWTAGLARVLVGVGKKLVADTVFAVFAAPILAQVLLEPSAVDGRTLWALLFAQAVYVYLDFSAYSDIAIGLGRQFGWRVPENFDYPFIRTNMRDFWRAWHISVSGWVMRWVHFFAAFPLRRSSPWLQRALPVVVSLVVIGLWHQLQLTWLLWGLHHALGILLGDRVTRQADSRVRRAGGLLFVLGWVALSHCFTLVSDPQVALSMYWNALSP